MGLTTVEVVTRSIMTLAVEYLVYGAYIMLFSTCVFVLVERQRKNMVLHLVTMTILFALATAGTVMNTLATLHSTFYQLGLRPKGSALVSETVILGIYILANALADMILIHRCFVIWTHRQTVIIPPMIISFLNNAVAIAALVSHATGKYTGPEGSALNDFGGYTIFTFLIVNAITNVCLTMLIAGRIWCIRKEVVDYLGSTVKKRYTMIVHIIIESGIIYPLALIICLVIQKTMEIDFFTQYALLIQIVGIAPTSIIVRAGLGVATENEEQPSLHLEAAQGPNAFAVGSTVSSFAFSHNRNPQHGLDFAHCTTDSGYVEGNYNDLDIETDTFTTRTPMAASSTATATVSYDGRGVVVREGTGQSTLVANNLPHYPKDVD